MPNKKISQLLSVLNSALGGSSVFPLVDSADGTTKKILISQLDLRWVKKSASGITAALGMPLFTDASGDAQTDNTLNGFLKLVAGVRSMVASPMPLTEGGTGGVTAAAAWNNIMPLGEFHDFGAAATALIAAGYRLVEANGAAVSRTVTYADLFAMYGTTWGAGDGSTTFNLPNASRRVRVGSGGTGSATLGNAVGNIGGEEDHDLITAEIPAHTHDKGTYNITSSGSHTHTANASLEGGGGAGAAAQNNPGASVGFALPVSVVASSHTHPNANFAGSSGSTGGGDPHNNMQPSMVVKVYIKY